MPKIVGVSKNDTGRERVYEAKLETGEIKSFPAYSTIKKIIVSYGLIRWMKKSNANTLTQEEVYKLVAGSYQDGADAISTMLYNKIFCGTGEDYADEQRNIGSHIHWLIEQFLSGREVPIQEEPFKYAWEQFLIWHRDHAIEVLPEGLELELVSLNLRAGGTIDMVAKIDGQLEIVDWKTSSGIFNDYPVQVAFYRALWNENNPDQPINNARIIRIPKKEWNVHKSGRSRNKLLELKLGETQLDFLLGLFTKARDWYEYMNATTTFNKLTDFLESKGN